MVSLTTGPSPRYRLWTSQGIPSVISLLVSVGGHMRSTLPTGEIDPSGLARVPVSPTPPLAGNRVTTIRATSGPSGSSSSASAALQSSLVSRLKARCGTGGSTVFAETWKAKTTPSGRPYWAHTASARRISGNGSTSWPSPKAQEDGRTLDQYEQGRIRGYETRKGKTTGGPSSKQGGLSIAVQLANWPSPKASNTTGARTRGKGGENLQTAASWATPTARDYRSESATDEYNVKRWGHSRGKPLSAEALLAVWSTPRANKWGFPDAHGSHEAPWPTPMAGSPATESYNEAGNTCNGRKTQLLVSGETSTGSPVATASYGQLNPAHSRWLMGYPPVWDACAVTVTPSSRKSRKSSSKAT